jgi:hypothetical protein
LLCRTRELKEVKLTARTRGATPAMSARENRILYGYVMCIWVWEGDYKWYGKRVIYQNKVEEEEVIGMSYDGVYIR